MKRRKLLIGMSLLATGVLVGYPGYRWIRWHLSPDLAYLGRSRKLLNALVDVIIPPTDSPGASECGVHDFVIKMISDCADIVTQHKFIDGLRDLESYVQSTFGKSFPDCSHEEKESTLRYFGERDKPWTGLAGKVQRKYLGSTFFYTLKRYCIIGYCTSEGGATQGLRYSRVPSGYVACEPYVPGVKAWATF